MAEAKTSAKSPDIGARDRLLAAAAEFFSRKGYSATTTREIVASAGVTKPVLYYYFQNKEGIYLELMRRAMAGFEEVVNTCLTRTGTQGRDYFLSVIRPLPSLWSILSRVINVLYLLRSATGGAFLRLRCSPPQASGNHYATRRRRDQEEGVPEEAGRI